MNHPWEDLVNDFLEIACRLSDTQRAFALDALRREGIQSEYMEVHPAFSIGGRLVVVVAGETIRECLCYFPDEQRMEKSPLTRAPA